MSTSNPSVCPELFSRPSQKLSDCRATREGSRIDHPMDPARKRVVVVGAGPGGLASALLLAGLGLEVTVLERHAHPGGRMGRLVEAGYALDTGPTILQLPQILEQIFARAGLALGDFVTLEKVEPNTRIHFWDGSHLDTSTDPVRNRDEWERLVPGGARAFDSFFETHAAKYRVAYDRFIAHDANSALSYFNPLRLLPAARYAPWESLYTSLLRVVKDERIVYAMSYPSKYLGLHPTTCSSVFSVIPYLELAFGVWHPRGGFRALADGMARAIETLGGAIRYGARVKRVVVEGGVARGVELESGERVAADHVVVNADLAAAKRRLLAPEERPSHGDRAIEGHAYSCSTFMLYLGMDKVYDQVPHHAIHLARSVTRSDRDALDDRALDEDDPPFYVCNPCVTDPSGAPPGHSTLYVLVPCPNTANAVDWQTKAAPFAAKMLERLALVGIDDAARHVTMQRIATAETWRDAFDVFRGAVFNLSHNWMQLGPMRPRSNDPDVERLHWVGGGTHPGSGLLTIFESANIVAAEIARRSGLTLAPSRAPAPGAPFSPARAR
jgi:phytoene desaturase